MEHGATPPRKQGSIVMSMTLLYNCYFGWHGTKDGSNMMVLTLVVLLRWYGLVLLILLAAPTQGDGRLGGLSALNPPQRPHKWVF